MSAEVSALAKQRSKKFLDYLSAVGREIGAEPVRDINKVDRLILQSDVQQNRFVKIGPTGTRESWLFVKKPPMLSPVFVPEELKQYIDISTLDNPDKEPCLRPLIKRDVEMSKKKDKGNLESKVPPETDSAPIIVENEDEVQRISEEFKTWKSTKWTTWLESNADILSCRRLHAKLYEMYIRFNGSPETLNITWGSSIFCINKDHKKVAYPLLSTDIRIEIDSATGDISLVPDDPTEMRISAIQGLGIPGIEGLIELRERVNQDPPDQWSEEARSAFNHSLIATLGTDARVVDNLEEARKSNVPNVVDAWCILLRQREDNRQQFYSDLAQSISDGEYFPEALASIFTDFDDDLSEVAENQNAERRSADIESQVLLPLPANEQQERIIKQLRTSQGVTVQGPPGTGKSHTIANLISNLLAQGKRVLVTSSKDQALNVVQEKIPDEIKDLTIAVLGSGPDAMSNLQLSARKMQDSLANLDIYKGKEQIKESSKEINALLEAERKNGLALKSALATQGEHYLFENGESLSAGDLAQRYVENIADDVIPESVCIGRDSSLPFSSAEFKRFVELAGNLEPQEIKNCSATLPDLSQIPDSIDLRQIFQKLDDYHQEIADLEELGANIAAVDVMSADWLQEVLQSLRETEGNFVSLGGVWEERLSAKVRENPAIVGWITVGNDKILTLAQEGLHIQQSGLLGHTVDVPDDEDVAQQTIVAERWRARINNGKGIPRFADKELRTFAENVLVNGQRPTSSMQIGLVLSELRSRELQKSINRLSEQLFSQLDIPHTFDGQSSFLDALNIATRVKKIVEFWSVECATLHEQISKLTILPYRIVDLQSFKTADQIVKLSAERLAEREITKRLREINTSLEDASKRVNASRLYKDFILAIQMRDPDSWEVAMSKVRAEAEKQKGARELLEIKQKMEDAGCGQWAAEIIDSKGTAAIPQGDEGLAVAWEMAKARTWLKKLNEGHSVQDLMSEAGEISRQKREKTISIVNLSARIFLKQSITDSQRRALNIWLQAIGRVGRGTGKQAPRFMAQAKAVLPQAMGAVPVWIMPIYRVLQNFDPRVSKPFDVIIVDESSQCDLLSVGVLALAKKAIIVGDDKQTSPESVGVPTDKIVALQNQYLKDFPGKAMFTVDASLYSLAESSFKSTVLLREHFRCVPEIIKFSNRFYNNEIIPLRETKYPLIGKPLHAVFVDSPSLRIGNHRINRGEARAIAAQIKACIEDPRYAGLTFGVVSFRSGSQSQIIENELRSVLSIQELEGRKIRVGNPPDFQGDERSVMFLSLVSDDNSFSATSKRYAQWANVAVSRAQEQLWVYYSMDPATLRPEDYARQIVEYSKDSHHEMATSDLFALTESKFERDVLKMLLDRGYEVTPQYRVGDYRLDLVVTIGEGYRLAIECDGDRYHGLDKWDDDVRRQRVLERLGWEFWRIRASEFYLDQEHSTGSLWKRLGEMSVEASERSVGPIVVKDFEPTVDMPQVSESNIIAKASDASLDVPVASIGQLAKYNFPAFSPIGDEDYLLQSVDEFKTEWLDANLRMLVDREYPLHVDRACQLMLRLLSANRVSSTVRQTLQQCLHRQKELIRRDGDFLYPVDIHIPVVRIPNPRTNIEHISTEELALAMLTIESFMDGESVENLFRETAKTYGFARLGNKVKESLQAAFEVNVRSGKFTVNDGKVYAIF